MSDTDLINLYSGKILELAGSIPHDQLLDAPCLTGKKRSPQCGSVVTVTLRLKDGKVCAFGQDVKACALGQASASAIGAAIIGQSKETITRGRDELHTMLTQDGPAPSAPWQELAALRAAAEFTNRHASILLCFDAALMAIESAEQA